MPWQDIAGAVWLAWEIMTQATVDWAEVRLTIVPMTVVDAVLLWAVSNLRGRSAGADWLPCRRDPGGYRGARL